MFTKISDVEGNLIGFSAADRVGADGLSTGHASGMPSLAGNRTSRAFRWWKACFFPRRALAGAVVALLSGCTAINAGVAVPADDLGHSPAPVPVAALEFLLLPPEQLDTLLHTSGLVLKNSRSTMANGPIAAEDCAAPFRNIRGGVYRGSGWIAVRGQYAADADGSMFRVWQGVVAFPMPVDAQAFYHQQVAAWHTCDNRRIDGRLLDDPTTNDQLFTLGEAREHDRMLSMTSTPEFDDGGWKCERVLTVRNNVAVDVDSCTWHLTDQSEIIADAIAEKVPVK